MWPKRRLNKQKVDEKLPTVPPAPPDEVLPYLNRLKNATEQALKAAEQSGLSDAVNWADLRAAEASITFDDVGFASSRVVIEEAAPDAHKLQAFVRQYLTKKGYRNVEVITRW